MTEDASMRELVGQRGRERVLECFTHMKIAQDTAFFYERLCRS